MCVITTGLIASGLTAIGASSLAASSVAVGTLTVGANALLGAGAGAAMTAATGSNNYGLGIGIGALGGALGAGLGMAAGGIETAATPAMTGSLQGTSEMVQTGALAEPGATALGAATPAEAAATTNSVMSKEIASLSTTGAFPTAETAAVGSGATGGVVTEAGAGVTASTAELLAKGAVAAGAGIAMGTMSYQSAVKAAEAQARAQEDQAEQMKLAGKLAEANAKNARIKAGMEVEAGELDAGDKARIARQESGAAIAKAAGSGVMVEPRKESMTTMLEADQKAELVYDQAKIMQNAQMRAWGYLAEGRNYDLEALGQRYGAAGLRSAARETRRAGKVNAWTSAIGSGLSTGASVGSLLI